MGITQSRVYTTGNTMGNNFIVGIQDIQDSKKQFKLYFFPKYSIAGISISVCNIDPTHAFFAFFPKIINANNPIGIIIKWLKLEKYRVLVISIENKYSVDPNRYLLKNNLDK
tara:strand:- start:422 stop:757 length:336 start_codon:yes stop_codon:yes gene_type:complete